MILKLSDQQLLNKTYHHLTLASQAQTFSKNMRPEKTKEILERVKGKTKNQATVELLKLSQGDTTAKAKQGNRI